jgi:hypothetical protein
MISSFLFAGFDTQWNGQAGYADSGPSPDVMLKYASTWRQAYSINCVRVGPILAFLDVHVLALMTST